MADPTGPTLSWGSVEDTQQHAKTLEADFEAVRRHVRKERDVLRPQQRDGRIAKRSTHHVPEHLFARLYHSYMELRRKMDCAGERDEHEDESQEEREVRAPVADEMEVDREEEDAQSEDGGRSESDSEESDNAADQEAERRRAEERREWDWEYRRPLRLPTRRRPRGLPRPEHEQNGLRRTVRATAARAQRELQEMEAHEVLDSPDFDDLVHCEDEEVGITEVEDVMGRAGIASSSSRPLAGSVHQVANGPGQHEQRSVATQGTESQGFGREVQHDPSSSGDRVSSRDAVLGAYQRSRQELCDKLQGLFEVSRADRQWKSNHRMKIKIGAESAIGFVITLDKMWHYLELTSNEMRRIAGAYCLGRKEVPLAVLRDVIVKREHRIKRGEFSFDVEMVCEDDGPFNRVPLDAWTRDGRAAMDDLLFQQFTFAIDVLDVSMDDADLRSSDRRKTIKQVIVDANPEIFDSMGSEIVRYSRTTKQRRLTLFLSDGENANRILRRGLRWAGTVKTCVKTVLPIDPVQCRVCRGFNHDWWKCRLRRKCKFCGEGHERSLCQVRVLGRPAKCALCKGGHRASQCYLKYVEAYRARRNDLYFKGRTTQRTIRFKLLDVDAMEIMRGLPVDELQYSIMEAVRLNQSLRPQCLQNMIFEPWYEPFTLRSQLSIQYSDYDGLDKCEFRDRRKLGRTLEHLITGRKKYGVEVLLAPDREELRLPEERRQLAAELSASFRSQRERLIEGDIVLNVFGGRWHRNVGCYDTIIVEFAKISYANDAIFDGLMVRGKIRECWHEDRDRNNEVVQCYRCLVFGHEIQDCVNGYTCMFCGDDIKDREYREHLRDQCHEKRPYECCNCDGSHIATFHGCRERLVECESMKRHNNTRLYLDVEREAEMNLDIEQEAEMNDRSPADTESLTDSDLNSDSEIRSDRDAALP